MGVNRGQTIAEKRADIERGIDAVIELIEHKGSREAVEHEMERITAQLTSVYALQLVQLQEEVDADVRTADDFGVQRRILHEQYVRQLALLVRKVEEQMNSDT